MATQGTPNVGGTHAGPDPVPMKHRHRAPRTPSRPAPQRGSGKGWPRRDEPVPPSEELPAFSRQPMSDLIVRGVITGLTLRPAPILKHSEILSEFVCLAD